MLSRFGDYVAKGSCNPYLYRCSYPHFARIYWTHNGPNNQTQCGYRSSPDSAPRTGNWLWERCLIQGTNFWLCK
jgi:hypothetical protein